MKHGFIKVLLLLAAITLFMALTGYTAKHRVIAVFINQMFKPHSQNRCHAAFLLLMWLLRHINPVKYDLECRHSIHILPGFAWL